ncbi:hypothetical protein Q5752_005782 [Cryptotrichosporon argae]
MDNTGIDVDKDFGGSNQQSVSQGQGNTESYSTDAYGNQGQPGQYAEQGQYGAVTGGGFGGGFAGNKHGQQEGQGQSDYEGFQQNDTTATGGYGRNAQGSAFSRANQMGADGGGEDETDQNDGYKTGNSTPGYRQEGDVDDEAARNTQLNQGLNPYGESADEPQN